MRANIRKAAATFAVAALIAVTATEVSSLMDHQDAVGAKPPVAVLFNKVEDVPYTPPETTGDDSDITSTEQDGTETEDAVQEEPVEEAYREPGEPVYYEGDFDGDYEPSQLTPQSGVNYFDGRTETYYSSNVLYHDMTPEWSAGEDGVYRDSDGYVVVAASDIPYGEEVGTSFGPGKVYDSGCNAGITDIYVNW